MSKFKWAIVGDAHWGVRGDNKIFHTIMVDFFQNLISDLQRDGINTLILLGDVFERRKFVNFETLYTCKRMVFDALRDSNIQTYIIAGNHDVYFKNTNRINSLELLLPVAEYPNIRQIIHTAEEITIDGTPVLFVPWVNKENYGEIYQTIEGTDATYMIAHLDMAGFEMHRGAVSEHGHFDMEFLGKFSKVISGHYHVKSSRGNVYYLGTPYATSWHDYGEDKGYHLFEDGEFTFVKNDTETFFRYVYDDIGGDMVALGREIKESDLTDKYIKLVIKSKKNLKLFEKFVELIESKRPADLNILDETNFIKDVEGSDDDGITDTISVIQNYIMKDLETGLSRDKLISNMTMLYRAAQELTDDD